MSVDAFGRFTTNARTAREPWFKSRVMMNGMNVNTSFHHVVPFAALRCCWDTLARNPTVDHCNMAIETWLRILGALPARQWRKDMENGALTFDQQLELDRRVTWPKWNIVEGPGNRSDDPGEGFDFYSHGITLSEAQRQVFLAGLNGFLLQFNEATVLTTPSPTLILGLFNCLITLERNLESGTVIFFDAGMWVAPEGAGQWRKRTSPPRYIDRHVYLYR